MLELWETWVSAQQPSRKEILKRAFCPAATCIMHWTITEDQLFLVSLQQGLTWLYCLKSKSHSWISSAEISTLLFFGSRTKNAALCEPPFNTFHCPVEQALILPLAQGCYLYSMPCTHKSIFPQGLSIQWDSYVFANISQSPQELRRS